MNNFKEDESTIIQIKIINPDMEDYVNNETFDFKTVKAEFYPESGVFLDGTSNTIGVKITDCNDLGIKVENIEVFDAKNEIISNFSTNEMGFGRFEIKETTFQKYKIKYLINNQLFEKELPMPTLKGINFSVNNYILPNKTSLKIKTNQKTITEKTDQKYALVIHKNDEIAIIDINLNNQLEQTIILPNEKFLNGLNTLTLIDKDNRKIAERIIFFNRIVKSNLKFDIDKKRNDSISFNGITNVDFSELSISVLPNKTKCIPKNISILNTFYFKSILKNNIQNTNYYFQNTNRIKQSELDNVLIASQTKYNWDKIMALPSSEEKFNFDNGLIIKGKINSEIKNIENYQIKLSALFGQVEKFTSINNKNEFEFKNVIFSDSISLHFMLYSKKENYKI